MSGKQFLLEILGDGEPHSLEEIEARAKLGGISHITVHSRVADLRGEGYDIEAVKEGQIVGYVLKGRQEGVIRVRPRVEAFVQGYEFDTASNDPRNGTICKILSRASASDNEVLENGPAFLVQFGDGSTDIVFSSELHPWFPV